MSFNRQHFFGREFTAFASQGPECSVALMATGAARDLRHFGDCQASAARAIEFGQTDERDMGHVKVQPHANGVSRHEIIHLARLEHRDLRIARPRGQRPHHDRSATAHTAQSLRHGIYLLD